MKRLRTLLSRALIGALLLVALGSSVASADPGTGSEVQAVAPIGQTTLPEDPGVGFQSDQLPQDPGIE